MKRICLQAGHKNLTSGSTGAPGERDWTSSFVPKVANILRSMGAEVYETDYFAYNDKKVTETDWDLFLAVHYDADIYNDRGGFADYPEPSTDFSTKESQRITKEISDYFFPATGIPFKPQRSNAHTRYYYMWKSLSAKTPCVLIECGVGWRKPEDYEVLRKEETSKHLAYAIAKSLGISHMEELNTCLAEKVELEKKVTELRDSRDKWKAEYNDVDRKYQELKEKYAKDMSSKQEHVESLQETMSQNALQMTNLNKMVDSLTSEKNELKTEITGLTEHLKSCRESLDEMLEQSNIVIGGLREKITELEKKLKTCNGKLGEGLKGYTVWELFLAIFRR